MWASLSLGAKAEQVMTGEPEAKPEGAATQELSVEEQNRQKWERMTPKQREAELGSVEREKRLGQAGAIMDGLTTHWAVNVTGMGAEANPLISTAPLALLAVTALKVGMVERVAGDESKDVGTRLGAGRFTSSLFGGVSVNNLAVLSGGEIASMALGFGLVSGIVIWKYLEMRQEEDFVAASEQPKEEGNKVAEEGPAQSLPVKMVEVSGENVSEVAR